MKICPYCKEDIKEDAIRCRYCQSYLVVIPQEAIKPETTESGRVTYILDRDLIRFVKFTGAILSVLVVVGLILYGIDLKQLAKDVQASVKDAQASAKDVQTSVEQTRTLV